MGNKVKIGHAALHTDSIVYFSVCVQCDGDGNDGGEIHRHFISEPRYRRRKPLRRKAVRKAVTICYRFGTLIKTAFSLKRYKAFLINCSAR